MVNEKSLELREKSLAVSAAECQDNPAVQMLGFADSVSATPAY